MKTKCKKLNNGDGLPCTLNCNYDIGKLYVTGKCINCGVLYRLRYGGWVRKLTLPAIDILQIFRHIIHTEVKLSHVTENVHNSWEVISQVKRNFGFFKSFIFSKTVRKINKIFYDVIMKSNLKNEPKLQDNVGWDETHIMGKNFFI